MGIWTKVRDNLTSSTELGMVAASGASVFVIVMSGTRFSYRLKIMTCKGL